MMISETDNRVFPEINQQQQQQSQSQPQQQQQQSSTSSQYNQQLFQINGQLQLHQQQIYQIFQYLEQQQHQLNQITSMLQQIQQKQIEPLVSNYQHQNSIVDQIQQNQQQIEQHLLQHQQIVQNLIQNQSIQHQTQQQQQQQQHLQQQQQSNQQITQQQLQTQSNPQGSHQPVAQSNQGHIQQAQTQTPIQSQAQQLQQQQQQQIQLQQQFQQHQHTILQHQHHQQNQYQPQISMPQAFQVQQQHVQPQSQQQLQHLQQQQSNIQQQLAQQQSQLISNPLISNIPSSQSQINLQANIVQMPLNMQTKFPPIQVNNLAHVNIKPVQLVNSNSAVAATISNKSSQFDENDTNFNTNINKQPQHVTLDSPIVQFRRPIPPTSPPQMQQSQVNSMESVSVHSNITQSTTANIIPSVVNANSTTNSTNNQANTQQQQLDATSKMEKTLQNDRLEQLEQQIGNVFQHASAQPSIINGPLVGVTTVAAVNAAPSSVQPQVHSQIINQSQQQPAALNLNQQNIS